ncbi:MAG: hypothetical protein ABIE70_13165 [bacterium]
MRFMKPGITALLVIVMVMACSKQEPVEPLTDAPFFKTLEAAQLAAADNGKYIVVDFYTDW